MFAKLANLEIAVLKNPLKWTWYTIILASRLVEAGAPCNTPHCGPAALAGPG